MMLTAILGALEDDGDDGEQSSYNKLLGTVIPLVIISIPMVLAFLYLRRFQNRVYAPRTYIDVLKDQSVLQGHMPLTKLMYLQREDTKASTRILRLDWPFPQDARRICSEPSIARQLPLHPLLQDGELDLSGRCYAYLANSTAYQLSRWRWPGRAGQFYL